jgi:hypothetical protein
VSRNHAKPQPRWRRWTQRISITLTALVVIAALVAGFTTALVNTSAQTALPVSTGAVILSTSSSPAPGTSQKQSLITSLLEQMMQNALRALEAHATSTFIDGLTADFSPGPVGNQLPDFAPGPEMLVHFGNLNTVGTNFDGGYVWARFIPGPHGTEHPVVKAYGDTSNLVVTPYKTSDNEPGLDISYRNAQPGDYGFEVSFANQGGYAYPVFTNLDLASAGKQCEVVGHTSSFRNPQGGGTQWLGFNALAESASAYAWFSKTSPGVQVNSGVTQLQYAGFQGGKPYAYFGVPQSENSAFVGFSGQTPIIYGAPQGSGASC